MFSGASIRAVAERHGVDRRRYPVHVVVLRRAIKRGWKFWRRYCDAYHVVTPNEVRRAVAGNSYPTRRAGPENRFGTYTVRDGCWLMAVGEAPHLGIHKTFRQAEPIKFQPLATPDVLEGYAQWMLHDGPGSYGCLTLPPGSTARFVHEMVALAAGYGNTPARTDAARIPENNLGPTVAVPFILHTT